MNNVFDSAIWYFTPPFLRSSNANLKEWLEQSLPNEIVIFGLLIIGGWTVIVLTLFSVVHAFRPHTNDHPTVPPWLRNFLQLFVILAGSVGIIFLVLDGFSDRETKGISYTNSEYEGFTNFLENQEVGVICDVRLSRLETGAAERAGARLACSWLSTTRYIASQLAREDLSELPAGLEGLEKEAADSELAARVEALEARVKSLLDEIINIEPYIDDGEVPRGLASAQEQVRSRSESVLAAINAIPDQTAALTQLRVIDDLTISYVTVLSLAVAIEVSLLMGASGGAFIRLTGFIFLVILRFFWQRVTVSFQRLRRSIAKKDGQDSSVDKVDNASQDEFGERPKT